jgi:hypothetical protein
MYEWQDVLRQDIDRLLVDDLKNQFVINLYGPPWGKTYFSSFYKDNPSVVCIHADETHDILFESFSNKIILLISIDILHDNHIDYYFNVEEKTLLSHIM